MTFILYQEAKQCLHIDTLSSQYGCNYLGYIFIFSVQCILWHFIKREVLLDISPLQLARIDVGDKRNWVHPKEVNSGFGAESTLKVVYQVIV